MLSVADLQLLGRAGVLAHALRDSPDQRAVPHAADDNLHGLPGDRSVHGRARCQSVGRVWRVRRSSTDGRRPWRLRRWRLRRDSADRWRRPSPADPRLRATGHRCCRLRRLLPDHGSDSIAPGGARVDLAGRALAAPSAARVVCELLQIATGEVRRGSVTRVALSMTALAGERWCSCATGWPVDMPNGGRTCAHRAAHAIGRARATSVVVFGRGEARAVAILARLTFAMTCVSAWACSESIPLMVIYMPRARAKAATPIRSSPRVPTGPSTCSRSRC